MSSSPTTISTLPITMTAAAVIAPFQAIGYDGNVASAAGKAAGLARTPAAAIGEHFLVDADGVLTGRAGAAIAAGADLEVGSAGKLVTLSAGVKVATAMEAAAADGDLFKIRWIPN